MQGYDNSTSPNQYALSSSSYFSDMDAGHNITKNGYTINIKNMSSSNKIELSGDAWRYNSDNGTTFRRNRNSALLPDNYSALIVEGGVSSSDLAIALSNLKQGIKQDYFTKR